MKAGLGVLGMGIRYSTAQLFCEACYGWYAVQLKEAHTVVFH